MPRAQEEIHGTPGRSNADLLNLAAVLEGAHTVPGYGIAKEYPIAGAVRAATPAFSPGRHHSGRLKFVTSS
jgi:hypothetical protein